MAKYTTEIRSICEHYAGLDDRAGYGDVKNIIDTARTKVFDFQYPIYDPEHKSELEKKILLHYYHHEIGFETLGEFKRALWSRMVDIMPYYNEMYRIDALEYDPFINVDYEVTGNDSRGTITHDAGGNIGQTKNTGTQESETDYTGTQNTETDYTGTQNTETDYTGTQDTDVTHAGSTTNTKTFANTDEDTKDLDTTVKHSDTPQGALTGISSDTYLSDATMTHESGTDTVSHTGTITDKLEYSDDMADTTTRTDNLNTDTTRTDNLNTDTTRTDNLNTDTLVTNNLQTDVTNNFTSDGTVNTTGNDYKHVVGKMSGTDYVDITEKLVKAIDNIDLMIINELKDLFLLLW